MTKKYYSIESATSVNYRGTKTHCTILYLGEQDIEQMNGINFSYLWSDIHQVFPLKAGGDTRISNFGPKGIDIPVQILYTENDYLLHQVNAVAKEFCYSSGLELPNHYPRYRPHITLPGGFDHKKLYRDITVFAPYLTSWVEGD